MSPAPFTFLMCSERSGSNLITRMMDSHPDVCGPFPKHLINPLARNLFRYGDLDDEAGWRRLLDDVLHLLGTPFAQWRTSFAEADLLRLAAPGRVGDLIRGIFLAEAAAAGKRSLFIKENQVYEYLPFLMSEFPEARYLVLVRDPRDMALSWKNSPIHAGGVVRAARQWRLDQVETLKHFWVLARCRQALLVRYEDLIATPEQSLQRICAFLGLAFNPAMLEFHRDALTQGNVGGMPAWENLSQEVLRNNKEKFRAGLSELEIGAIEHLCGREMAILGYRSASAPETLAGIDEAAVERLHDAEARLHSAAPPERVRQNMAAKRAFYQHGEPLPRVLMP